MAHSNTLSQLDILKCIKSDIKNKKEMQKLCMKRHKTIQVLKNLCEKLEGLEHNCQVAETRSKDIHIIGGFLKLLGYGALAFGHPIVGARMIKGGYWIHGAGATISIGTALVECGLTNSYIEQLKEVLREDEVALRSYAYWMDSNAELFYAIFGFSLDDESCNDMLNIVDQLLIFVDESSVQFNEVMVDLEKTFRPSKDLSSLIKNLGGQLECIYNTVRKNEKMIKPLREICYIFRKNSIKYRNFVKCSKTVSLEGVHLLSMAVCHSLSYSTLGLTAEIMLSGIFVAQSLLSRLQKLEDTKEDPSSLTEQAKTILDYLEVQLHSLEKCAQ